MTSDCFFVADIHGSTERYEKLLEAVRKERPGAVFLGGDLLPTLRALGGEAVVSDPEELAGLFDEVRRELGEEYPRVFLILGNDDPRSMEADFIAAGERGAWTYLHNRRAEFEGRPVFGYSFVPPTPFLNKDWERYDVSRYVDPGCVSPEEGHRSVPVDPGVTRYKTIMEDLENLLGEEDLSSAVLLFHTPPYQTNLDLTGLAGQMIDHVPLDPHVGSIAVRRLIEERGPKITLHGHIHESAHRTGSWRDRIQETHLLGAAHHGPELALVRFNPDHPESAERELL